MKTLPSPLYDPLEDEFLTDVIRFARDLGWRVAHFRAAKTSQGWRTPVQADGKGFPDLLLVRERVVAVELKRDHVKGRKRSVTSPDQEAWLEAFRVAGVEAYVWRPVDLDEIIQCLRLRDPKGRA